MTCSLKVVAQKNKQELAEIAASIPATDFSAAHLQQTQAEKLSAPLSASGTVDHSGFSKLTRLELTCVKAMGTPLQSTSASDKLRCKVCIDALPYMSIRMQALVRGSSANAKSPGM